MQALPACAGDAGRVVFPVDRSLDFRICVRASALMLVGLQQHDTTFSLSNKWHSISERNLKARIGFSKTCGRLTVRLILPARCDRDSSSRGRCHGRPEQALPLARWPLLGMESHLRSDGEKLAGTQPVVK